MEADTVNLGPINFKLGLPLNINKNDGQHKFEVVILKNVAKMANFRPKIGHDGTFAPTLSGNNSAIFIRFGRSKTPESLVRQDKSNGVKI